MCHISCRKTKVLLLLGNVVLVNGVITLRGQQISTLMMLCDTKLCKPQALTQCPPELLGCTNLHCRFCDVNFAVLLSDRLGGLHSKKQVYVVHCWVSLGHSWKCHVLFLRHVLLFWTTSTSLVSSPFFWRGSWKLRFCSFLMLSLPWKMKYFIWNIPHLIHSMSKSNE